MINELNNEEDFNIELIDKIKNNYLSSKQHFLHFIDNFDSEYIVNNAPEYAIDNDGEIMLEWYGRIGARINLTFGKNGELYFISLVHGETTKSQLFINSFALDKIKNELTKLFNGKN